MSYMRDRDQKIRGVGAIAATDAVASPQRMQQRTVRRRLEAAIDRRRADATWHGGLGALNTKGGLSSGGRVIEGGPGATRAPLFPTTPPPPPGGSSRPPRFSPTSVTPTINTSILSPLLPGVKTPTNPIPPRTKPPLPTTTVTPPGPVTPPSDSSGGGSGGSSGGGGGGGGGSWTWPTEEAVTAPAMPEIDEMPPPPAQASDNNTARNVVLLGGGIALAWFVFRKR